MIKEMGNCGHTDKVIRIFKAWKNAKKNNCGIVFVFDECVYGKAYRNLSAGEVADISLVADLNDIHFVHHGKIVETFPWWDIVKVNVLW